VEFEVFRIDLVAEGTALVTMDRPEKLNAMNREFFAELPRVLESLDRDPDVGVCVLTGAGRAFSAGGDIETFSELAGIEDYRAHLRAVYDAFHAVERCAVPVIVAVNGIAFGGGTELTLTGDLALASEEARFAFKEATLGLMPGYGVLRGPQVIGRRWTRRLAMTGEEIDAETAARIGLVEEVVAADYLLPRCLELAGEILAHPRLGVRLAKQFVNRDQGAPGQAESIEATALLFTSDEHKRLVRRFLAGGDRKSEDS